MNDQAGPFRLAEKRSGRPIAFKLTATSLLQLKDGITIIGTADGQVILPANGKNDALVSALKVRKPVTRLIRVSNEAFFAICGGELFLLDLRTLSRKPSLQNLRGVADACFLERDRGTSSLCIVTSSSLTPASTSPGPASSSMTSPSEEANLHFYTLNISGQTEKIREVAIRDAVGIPTQITWCSPTVVCVGGTKSAILVDGKGALKKIPLVVDAKKGPIILKLREDRVLLSSAGGIGVVVDLNGFPCPNIGTIVWSSSPAALVCSGPYVVALSDEGCIEVALLDSPGSILQTFTLSGASGAMCSDVAFNDESIAHDGEVDFFSFLIGLAAQHSDVPFRKAEAIPIKDQVKKLLEADAGDCTRALALIRDSFSSLEKRQGMENFVYLQAAAVLLQGRHDWDKAFALLSVGGVDAARLLAMCGYVMAEEQEQEASHDGNVELIRNLLQTSDLFQDRQFKMQVQDYVLKMRGSSGPTTRLDTAIVFLLADIGTKDALELFCKDTSNRCNLELCVGRLDALGLGLASALLVASRSENKLSMKLLQRFMDLDRADLFWEILMRADMKKQEEQEMRLVISTSLTWMLRKLIVPQAQDLLRRVAFLLDDLRPIETLDSPDRFLLLSTALEAKREQFGQSVDVSVLATCYVRAMEEACRLDQKRDPETFKHFDSLVHESSSAARAALDLLEVSKYKTRLGRERATCLGAFGRHLEALKIFVGELNDYEGAERYCEQHQSPTRARTSADAAGTQIDPFTALLSIHLERFANASESDVSSTRAEAAMGFLSRHANRVNPLEAVQVLPETISLSTALQFLERAMLRVVSNRRSARIEKNLARGENLGVKLKLVAEQKKPFVVTTETICKRCNVPFGLADDIRLVRDPITGLINHLECPQKPVSVVASPGRGLGDDDVADFKQLS